MTEPQRLKTFLSASLSGFCGPFRKTRRHSFSIGDLEAANPSMKDIGHMLGFHRSNGPLREQKSASLFEDRISLIRPVIDGENAPRHRQILYTSMSLVVFNSV